MAKSQFGDNFQLIRSVWGMNRKQMGKIFNCTEHQIGSYERMNTNATPALLFKLEDMTGIAARRLYYEQLERTALPQQPLTTAEKTENTPPQYLLPNTSLEERVKRLEAKVFGKGK
jgi:hypothetical protein